MCLEAVLKMKLLEEKDGNFFEGGDGGKCWWTYLLQVRLLVVEPVIR